MFAQRQTRPQSPSWRGKPPAASPRCSISPAGPFNVIAACRTTNVRLVLTSRAFVEQGQGSRTWCDSWKAHVRFVWIEDLRDGASAVDKFRAWLARRPGLGGADAGRPRGSSFSPPAPRARPRGWRCRTPTSSPTSRRSARDSTSRRRTSSSIRCRSFHSFRPDRRAVARPDVRPEGLSLPDPLHYRQIPELIYEVNATALFGHRHFLAGYARNANAYDFRSLRYVVCGAEPVKAETRRVYMEKFGLRILEATASPKPRRCWRSNSDVQPSRHGRPPDARRRAPAGAGSRLRRRRTPARARPNVMTGYYRVDRPASWSPRREAGTTPRHSSRSTGKGSSHQGTSQALRQDRRASSFASRSWNDWPADVWPDIRPLSSQRGREERREDRDVTTKPGRAAPRFRPDEGATAPRRS